MRKLFRTIRASLAEGRLAPRFGWWLLRRKWMKPFLDRAVDCLPSPDRGKIVFHAFSGRFDCNPKYVANEWRRRHPDADIVWVLDSFSYGSPSCALPAGMRAVCLGTRRAFREIATAGVVVENARRLLNPGMPKKRPGQFWINTWHGSLGIKRLDTMRSDMARQSELAAHDIDALLSNSAFENDVFRGWIFSGTNVVPVGHPRNDIFFASDECRRNTVAAVRRELGLSEGVHLALYAPTFRDGVCFSGAADFDFGRWRVALRTRFGGEWRVAVRMHPRDARSLADGVFSLPDNVVNASEFPDMQELMLAADVAITDYSSWIFDYLLSGRPGFLLATDLRKFDQKRGFYYSLSETPFPVAESESELVRNIAAFNEADYRAKVAAFLKGKGCVEDGHASERVCDLIEAFLDRGEGHAGKR